MTQRESRPNPPGEGRTGSTCAQATTPAPSVSDRFNEAYQAAREWVDVNGRKQWPDLATNDDIWALSIAGWWTG